MLGKKHYLPWSQGPGLLVFASLRLIACVAVSPSIEGFIEEAIKVGEGVEGLGEEREGHFEWYVVVAEEK